MRKLVQTEDPKFVRDTSSMALINNDKAAYLQYKARRAQGNKVSELSTEVASLKPVSYTHLRAHETDSYLVCRLLL